MEMERQGIRIWFVILCFLVSSCLLVLVTNHHLSLNTTNYVLTVSINANRPQNSVVLSFEPNNTSTTHGTTKIDFCVGKYVYVHNLPTKFNEDVVKDCGSLVNWVDMCPYLENSGLGRPLLDDQKDSTHVPLNNGSWFLTNQFSLEMIFKERMKRYKCLTNDSSLASAIFVPFYPGFDVGRHLWGYNTTIRDALAHELAKRLYESREWKGMNGRDHFLVAGRVGWDFRRTQDKESEWGNDLMFLPEFANTTLLTIESTSWSNDFAIPYPTYFHPWSSKQVSVWQKQMKSKKRKYLFSFVGAARPNMEGSIRGELMKQCIESKNVCKFIDCKSGICDHPMKIMKLFQNSVFCLQPSGDSYTRRSTFDSILGGCIPVFFHPASAYAQYMWYLPKNHSEYSIFLPENEIKNGRIDVKKMLSALTKKEVVGMRNEVVRMIPKLVYANPQSTEIFEDAFEIAVARVIETVEKVRRDVEEGKHVGIDSNWTNKVARSIGSEHDWISFLKI